MLAVAPWTGTRLDMHPIRRAAWLVTTQLLSVLVAGCETLPERFSANKLSRVGSEVTTADGIHAELGTASLVRENDRLWIYAWQDSVPYASRSLLVVEFDADGRLQHHEIARAVKPSHGSLEQYAHSARYCTVGGVCIEHGVDTDDGTTYDDTFSAVIVRGAAKARIRPTEPRADECVLVIWPDEGWNESRSTVQTPYGVALSVDGAPGWPSFRWVPTGAFARIVLPAGDHVVSVRDPVWDERVSYQDTPSKHFWPAVLDSLLAAPPAEFDLPPSSAPFHCWTGEQVFLRISATFVEKQGEHWFPIVLRSMEPAEAQARISDLALLLPPDH